MAVKEKQIFTGLMRKVVSFFCGHMNKTRNCAAHNEKIVLSGVIAAAVAVSMIPILSSPVHATDGGYWTVAENYDMKAGAAEFT